MDEEPRHSQTYMPLPILGPGAEHGEYERIRTMTLDAMLEPAGQMNRAERWTPWSAWGNEGTMSDVMTQHAEQVKQQARTTEEQRRWELHRQEQIDTRWPVYWQAVIHTVKQEVATFNAQFPADLAKHLYVETPAAGHELTVRRPSEPPNRAVRLIRATVLPEGCIRLTLIEIIFNPPGGHDISTERLVFEVANGGGVGVLIDGVVSDPLVTARAILKPLFRG